MSPVLVREGGREGGRERERALEGIFHNGCRASPAHGLHITILTRLDEVNNCEPEPIPKGFVTYGYSYPYVA